MQANQATPLYCPKCGEANDGAAERCVRCHAHLYIECRDCGAKNLRAQEECVKCGADLHRVKRKRHVKAPQFESDFPKALVVCLFILVALVGWMLWHTRGFRRPF